MNDAPLVVAYHSGFGHTARLAQAVAAGSSEAGAATELVVVGEITQEQWDVLDTADAIIFGSPTYMGNVAAEFQQFAEATAERFLATRWSGKLAAGFTNSGCKSGDKLHTLESLAIFASQHQMHWINLGQLPGWNTSAGSINDVNRLGYFLGAGAQSDIDTGADQMSEADLTTGRLLGERVAHVAATFRAGQRVMAAAVSA